MIYKITIQEEKIQEIDIIEEETEEISFVINDKIAFTSKDLDSMTDDGQITVTMLEDDKDIESASSLINGLFRSVLGYYKVGENE